MITQSLQFRNKNFSTCIFNYLLFNVLRQVNAYMQDRLSHKSCTGSPFSCKCSHGIHGGLDVNEPGFYESPSIPAMQACSKDARFQHKWVDPPAQQRHIDFSQAKFHKRVFKGVGSFWKIEDLGFQVWGNEGFGKSQDRRQRRFTV